MDYIPYAIILICILLLIKVHSTCVAEKEKYKKLLSQKKSTEVRTGHIVEKFAPLLDAFPHNPQSAVFLGQPIDYVVFEDTGVTFSEIKSGNAQLSKKQRLIRDHIKSGRVYWEEIRVNESK